MLRDPLRALGHLRPLLWAQVPHFAIGGVGVEFYLGALALVAINGDGNFLIKPGGGGGIQVWWDAPGPWHAGVNFAPLVFVVWLGRIERALYRAREAQSAAASEDQSP